MSNRLSGKRILITGAAQGIGLAIAKACAAEGAGLFLIDMDSALMAREAEALKAAGAMLGCAVADITDAARIEAIVAQAGRESAAENAVKAAIDFDFADLFMMIVLSPPV